MKKRNNDRLDEGYDGIPQYILDMTSEELDAAIAEETKRVEELNKLKKKRSKHSHVLPNTTRPK